MPQPSDNAIDTQLSMMPDVLAARGVHRDALKSVGRAPRGYLEKRRRVAARTLHKLMSVEAAGIRKILERYNDKR